MSELIDEQKAFQLEGLVSFFDMLARFDYEDKQKEGSVLNAGSLVSAPKESALSTET